MTTTWSVTPPAERFWLRRATVSQALVDGVGLGDGADGLVECDLLIDHGDVAAVARPDAAPDPATASVDLDRGMVWPCFVDMHTHLDKGHIWARTPNPNGTFDSALEAARADRLAHWNAEDVRRRMEFSLRCAFAHGTALIRTHLDSMPPQDAISWEVFSEVRERWADRIALQAAALIPVDLMRDEAVLAAIADRVRAHRGVMGGVPLMAADLAETLDRLMRIAADRSLDLDLHVDETGDPNATTLRAVAEAALRNRFPKRIVCGHCCSLAVQPEDEALRTLDLVAEAGIAIVSLPMCNMYLQDRQAGRTPRWRGVTLLHEMRARGIAVAVASDNTRDPFYAYGDLDMVETFREATRILHLDHPFGEWPRLVAAGAGDILGRSDKGRIKTGEPADLVLFRARTWTELLSRPQSDRIVLRGGQPIDQTLPDYRELDAITE